MKKSLVMTLVLVFVLGLAGTAFAGPFADVPAKHWAYDAVSKLAAAGIVDGYGDGTFLGDKTMTRYEMAQIVGKAIEKSDKAEAEHKALINKLADEFASELDSLGVRVSTLEKKIGNITWSGQVRSWYEWVEDVDTARNTRLLLFMNAPLTKDLTFKGRLWAETGWGNQSYGAVTGSDVSMDQAYIQGKNFTFGRQGIMLGKGLTYAWFPNNDGFTYTMSKDKLKLTALAFKGNDFAFGESLNFVAADVAYKATEDLDLTAVYIKNKDSDVGGNVIDTFAVGFGYKGIKNIAITAEYGSNSSDVTKAMPGHDSAKAWVAQAKYKDADWTKPHTFGLFAGYRNADDGFVGRNGDYIWETPVGIAGLHNGGYTMNDIKGADVGVEYTVFNNAVATIQYFDLEAKSTDHDAKGFVAQLQYFF